jgi:hypothetical protein
MFFGVTVTAEPPGRAAARAQTIGTRVAVFVLAFLYRLPDATELINDHFMHLVFARQLLWGRLPVRDAVSLGMPLQTGLSAFAEWLVGYRLLSEALIISIAFAAAAVLTVVVIQRATGSLLIAIAGALLEGRNRTPDLQLPEAHCLCRRDSAVVAIYRSAVKPPRDGLGLATAVAFYLRHDHGLYLGLSAVAVMAMRHGRSLRTAVQQIACPGGAHVCCCRSVLRVCGRFGSVRAYRRTICVSLLRGRFEQPVRLAVMATASLAGIAQMDVRTRQGGSRSTSGGVLPRRTPIAASRRSLPS